MGSYHGIPLQLGKWYQVKIVLLASTLKCYIDDNSVMEESGAPSATGRIGLETSGLKVSVANIKIRPKSSATIPKTKNR